MGKITDWPETTGNIAIHASRVLAATVCARWARPCVTAVFRARSSSRYSQSVSQSAILTNAVSASTCYSTRETSSQFDSRTQVRVWQDVWWRPETRICDVAAGSTLQPFALERRSTKQIGRSGFKKELPSPDLKRLDREAESVGGCECITLWLVLCPKAQSSPCRARGRSRPPLS